MFKDKLLPLPVHVRESAREIRLRAEQAIAVEYGTDRHFIRTRVTREDLKSLVEIFCDYSLHSYAGQLAQGFITLKGGHRAGFSATAVLSGGEVTAVRDITSINLRIAREFVGCSDELYGALSGEIKSLLIIGKPMSAKTTVLRDYARKLSDSGNKVTVIDERSEIASSGFDLGMNTDVLAAFPKRAGFVTALRALSPDFIVCDEIAGDGEEVAQCLNSGVGVVMTAHCGSLEEAQRSRALSGIMEHVGHVALLGTGKNIGKLQGLWKYENGFCNILPARGDGGRLIPLGGAQKAGASALGAHQPARADGGANTIPCAGARRIVRAL